MLRLSSSAPSRVEIPAFQLLLEERCLWAESEVLGEARSRSVDLRPPLPLPRHKAYVLELPQVGVDVRGPPERQLAARDGLKVGDVGERTQGGLGEERLRREPPGKLGVLGLQLHREAWAGVFHDFDRAQIVIDRPCYGTRDQGSLPLRGDSSSPRQLLCVERSPRRVESGLNPCDEPALALAQESCPTETTSASSAFSSWLITSSPLWAEKRTRRKTRAASTGFRPPSNSERRAFPVGRSRWRRIALNSEKSVCSEMTYSPISGGGSSSTGRGDVEEEEPSPTICSRILVSSPKSSSMSVE